MKAELEELQQAIDATLKSDTKVLTAMENYMQPKTSTENSGSGAGSSTD